MASLTYDYESQLFVWRGSFDERHLPKQAGFSVHPTLRKWVTSNVENAAKLVGIADTLARNRIEHVARRVEQSYSAEPSYLHQEVFSVPCPPGEHYEPFQLSGIESMIERLKTSGVLLADEMGLGKTIQFIGLMNAIRDELHHVLITCPATLKYMWRDKLSQWLVKPMRVTVLDGLTPFPQSGVVIVNDEIFSRFEERIYERKWDLFGADEAHRYKNGQSQRTQRVIGKKSRLIVRREVFITGSPLLNRPIELWPLLHRLDPKMWPNRLEYSRRYCNGKMHVYGYKRRWDESGATNLEELSQKLRATVMIRRLKKEVLTELPPKYREVIELPASGAAATLLTQEFQQAAKLARDLKSLILRLKSQGAGVSDPLKFTADVARLKEAEKIAFEKQAEYRKLTGLAKTQAVIAYVKELFMGGVTSAVLFAHHKDVISEIATGLNQLNPVIITGDTPVDKRKAIVDTFQNDPDCRIFIGNIQAAGVGLTLTKSSRVLFAELDWVPGNMSQAEDRCHRITQKDNVIVSHLVLNGSLDSKMAKAMIKKQNDIDAAMGDAAKLKTLNDGLTEWWANAVLD